MYSAAVEGSDGQGRTASSSSSPSNDQENSELVWAFEKLKDNDKTLLKYYIQFASTACIPGGGCDIEQALDVLYKCKGDIMHATNQLLTRETDGQIIWTLNEKQSFEQAFSRYPKNFCLISKELRTKSVKDCVRYYYLWKKSLYRGNQTTPKSNANSNSILPEISNNTVLHYKLGHTYQSPTNNHNQTYPLQQQQQQQHQHQQQNQLHTQSILVPLTSTGTNQSTFQLLGAIPSSTTALISPPPACAPDSILTPSSSASDESRDSGRGETSLDDSSYTNQPRHLVYYQQQYPEQHFQGQQPMKKELNLEKHQHQLQVEEVFPCKVCGREFAKIKSRSAHMKRHKNEKLYG